MSRTHLEYHNPIDLEDVHPTQDFLLLERITREKSGGGIFYAEKTGESNTECYFGRVIAHGPGETQTLDGKPIPFEFKKGDIVLIMKYDGEKLHIVGGKEYQFVRSNGVWAKVELDEDGEVKVIHPYRQRCVIKWDAEEKTMSGLLHLVNPATWLRVGTIVKVGPGYIHPKTGARIPLTLKGGERVILKRYIGADVRVAGETVRVVEEMDIDAVIEGQGDVDTMIKHDVEKQQEQGGGIQFSGSGGLNIKQSRGSSMDFYGSKGP